MMNECHSSTHMLPVYGYLSLLTVATVAAVIRISHTEINEQHSEQYSPIILLL